MQTPRILVVRASMLSKAFAFSVASFLRKAGSMLKWRIPCVCRGSMRWSSVTDSSAHSKALFFLTFSGASLLLAFCLFLNAFQHSGHLYGKGAVMGQLLH